MAAVAAALAQEPVGQEAAIESVSVWRQTLAPGAATPPHCHARDEVVLCLSRFGQVRGDEDTRRFGTDSTIVLPAGRLHQIVNTGPLPMEIIGVFAATPLATELLDGTALELPWRS